MRTLIHRTRFKASKQGRRLLRVFDDLHGQIQLQEAEWLFHHAKGRRRIVEIGSFRGKSAVFLALGSADVGGRLLCIDPHKTFHGSGREQYGQADHDALMAAIQRHGVADRVTPVLRTSEDAHAEYDGAPIDLLWVDGDHNYEPARRDFELWAPHVAVGGIIAGHDYSHGQGVRRAWDEIVGADPAFSKTGRCRSIAWATRTAAPAQAPHVVTRSPAQTAAKA